MVSEAIIVGRLQERTAFPFAHGQGAWFCVGAESAVAR